MREKTIEQHVFEDFGVDVNEDDSIKTKEEAIIRLAEIEKDLVPTSDPETAKKWRKLLADMGYEILLNDEQLYEFNLNILLDEKNELKQKFNL